MNSTGSVREIAKLFSNNLYGKEASNTDSSFKVIDLKEDGSLSFKIQEEYEKEPGYIPIGSAITSHARYYIMKIAQANYHGVDRPGFIYCDTDSIHLDSKLEDVIGISEDPTIYGKFKCEATWDTAIFTRQKTYIEHVVEENHKQVKVPYYNVKCAGMPQTCKDLFIKSILKSQDEIEPDFYEWRKHYEEAELKFFFDWRTKEWRYRDLNSFNLGLSIPGKLFPKHIKGGVLLVEGPYTMR